MATLALMMGVLAPMVFLYNGTRDLSLRVQSMIADTDRAIARVEVYEREKRALKEAIRLETQLIQKIDPKADVSPIMRLLQEVTIAEGHPGHALHNVPEYGIPVQEPPIASLATSPTEHRP